MAKKIKGPGEIKVGKKFAYLRLPDGMEECFYDLELQEVKEVGEQGNIAFVWIIIDTDTKAKVDSTINGMLNPFQKLAHIYFWKELFSIALALQGKEITQKRVDKLTKKHDQVRKDFMSNSDKYIGKRARCVLSTRVNDDGDTKVDRTWEMVPDDSDTDNDDE